MAVGATATPHSIIGGSRSCGRILTKMRQCGAAWKKGSNSMLVQSDGMMSGILEICRHEPWDLVSTGRACYRAR
jgi:hypothetical protein